MATVGLNLVPGTNQLKLVTPYHPDLPARARKLGGTWRAAEGAWYFDERDADLVRDLVRTIYGLDPLSEQQDLVTARVRLRSTARTEDSLFVVGGSLFLFGREIASRPGRDRPVRLGQGVIVLSGGFPERGGSARYPELLPIDDTLIEVRDVPRSLVEAKRKAHPDAIEIVADAATSPTLQQLKAKQPAAAPPLLERVWASVLKLPADDQQALLARLDARLSANVG